MHYTLIDESVREILDGADELWQQESQESYEKGYAVLQELRGIYEEVFQESMANEKLSASHVFTLAYIKCKLACFGHATCRDIRDWDLRYRKLGFCCTRLEEAKKLCAEFSDTVDLPAVDWLQLQLLAAACLHEKALIGTRALGEHGRAVGCLGAAECIIDKIMVRNESGELASCLGAYVDYAYVLGSRIIKLRGSLSENNQRLDIALRCYLKDQKYTSWLAEHADSPSWRSDAANELISIGWDITRVRSATGSLKL